MNFNLEALSDKLSKVKVNVKVTALPDFFIDHFYIYPSNLNELIRDLIEVASKGGGNIFKGEHYFLRGGCAANFAAALARLNVNVKLITKTSKFGFEILRMYAENVDLSHVKIVDDQAITFILEVGFNDRRVNIMISNPGPIRKFCFEDLDSHDLNEIVNSDIVAIFTWNANLCGTELVEKVFNIVKFNGHGKTYLDLGDPSARINELGDLVGKVLKRDLVDALSLNENELKCIAKVINLNLNEDLIEIARKVSIEIPVRIDFHTSNYSLSALNGDVTIVPSFKVKVLRSTGAGDAWNAGNVYGWAGKFNFEERLLIANAVAAYYISNKKAIHPSLIDLTNFIKKRKLRLTPC